MSTRKLPGSIIACLLFTGTVAFAQSSTVETTESLCPGAPIGEADETPVS